MKRRGVKESDPFDWEKITSPDNNQPIGNISSTPGVVTRPSSGYESCNFFEIQIRYFDWKLSLKLM